MNKDKALYYRILIFEIGQDSKKIWWLLCKVLHRIAENVLSSHKSEKSLADLFASFSSVKITKIPETFSNTDSFAASFDCCFP